SDRPARVFRLLPWSAEMTAPAGSTRRSKSTSEYTAWNCGVRVNASLTASRFPTSTPATRPLPSLFHARVPSTAESSLLSHQPILACASKYNPSAPYQVSVAPTPWLLVSIEPLPNTEVTLASALPRCMERPPTQAEPARTEERRAGKEGTDRRTEE